MCFEFHNCRVPKKEHGDDAFRRTGGHTLWVNVTGKGPDNDRIARGILNSNHQEKVCWGSSRHGG